MADLEEDAHFGDGAVVVSVEAGSCDLHASIKDEERMGRLPVRSLVDVEERRGDEVLHFAVVRAREESGGVVFEFKEDRAGDVIVGKGVPGNGAALRGDFSSRQVSAEGRFKADAAANADTASQRWAPGIGERAVVRAARKGVTEQPRKDVVAVLGVSGDNANLHRESGIPKSVLRSRIVLDVRWRQPIELKAIESDNAATAAVAVVHSLRARDGVLIREGESIILREAWIRLDERSGPARLEFAHLVVVRKEMMCKGLLGDCAGRNEGGDGKKSEDGKALHGMQPI